MSGTLAGRAAMSADVVNAGFMQRRVVGFAETARS